MDELKRLRGSDQDTIKDLKAQLKRAQNDVKEMKLLLDMYKTCTKEQRDKAQLMAAEKKVRAELEDTRSQVKFDYLSVFSLGSTVFYYFFHYVERGSYIISYF